MNQSFKHVFMDHGVLLQQGYSTTQALGNCQLCTVEAPYLKIARLKYQLDSFLYPSFLELRNWGTM